MSQFFTLLTKTGQGLLANAIAYGQPLTIAEMAIGDGGGKLPAPNASVTRLVNEVRRGPINQTTTDPNNPNWTVVEQVLPAEVGGWTIREVGLYDTDGNLIAYGNYPETYKPQLSEGAARTQTIRFVMEVTNTSAVTLRIDPSVVMASRKYVDDTLAAHEKSRNHPDADTKNKGMLRFATLAESRKGEESKAAQTPAGGKAQLDDHRKEEAAHKAGQIVLDNLLTAFGNAENVQAVLALLGSAATKGEDHFQTALDEKNRRNWGAWDTNGTNDLRGTNEGKARRAFVTNKDRLIINYANDYPEVLVESALRTLGDIADGGGRTLKALAGAMWTNDNCPFDKSGSGRVTLKNGFILQWVYLVRDGYAYGTNNVSYNTFGFNWPIRFPNNCLASVGSLSNLRVGAANNMKGCLENATQDGARFAIGADANFTNQAMTAFAIGN